MTSTRPDFDSPLAALRSSCSFLRHGTATANLARSPRFAPIRAPFGITTARPRTASPRSSVGTNGPRHGAASLSLSGCRRSCTPQASHIRSHSLECAITTQPRSRPKSFPQVARLTPTSFSLRVTVLAATQTPQRWSLELTLRASRIRSFRKRSHFTSPARDTRGRKSS